MLSAFPLTLLFTSHSSGLSLPPIDDHTSRTNTITVFCRFTLAEVLISVSKCADKIDTPYLMVRVDRLCADAAITSYGAALHASLGGVQLVDKIHLGWWLSQLSPASHASP